eukprot:scaffold50473_cov59-Attheya_sp.AAC.9
MAVVRSRSGGHYWSTFGGSCCNSGRIVVDGPLKDAEHIVFRHTALFEGGAIQCFFALFRDHCSGTAPFLGSAGTPARIGGEKISQVGIVAIKASVGVIARRRSRSRSTGTGTGTGTGGMLCDAEALFLLALGA